MPEEIVEEQPKAGFLNRIKIHKWKILGGVLGILVLAGAVFGAYKFGQRQVQPVPKPTPKIVVIPTSDLTVNWKIFNSQCGFTIKYPDGWKIDGAPICGSLRAPNWEEGNVPEPRGLSLRFSRWEKGTKTSVFSKGTSTPLTINTLEDYIRSHGNDGEQVSEVKDKTYGELSGKEFILALEAEATSYTYFIFMRDDFIYTVDWNNKYIENYGDDINLMLSTFKFLPSTDSTGSPQAGSGQGE
jgi:hypothetical protein